MKDSLRRSVLAALLSAAIGLAQAPANPPRGSISGTVASLAGQPLKNSIVRLQVAFVRENGPTGPQARSYATSSDDQGNFLFENLEPAGYVLSAEHTGYLRAVYSSDTRSANSVVDVSSGQQLSGIAVKMTPQGLIAGRITNQDDEPLPNIRVVLTHWVYVNGRRQLQPVNGGGASDADGAFAMGNLPAGNYYLSAVDQNSPLMAGLRGHAGQVETHVTTYYPGVTEPSSATPIQLTAGAIVRGVDIRMRQGVLYRVLGKVLDPASPDPPATVFLSMFLKDAGNLGGPSAQAIYNHGAFEFSAVPPGFYILQATVRPNPQQNPAPQAAGRQLVTVGNGDVEGVIVHLSPAFAVSGRFSTEGSAAPSPPAGASPRAFVNLVSIDGLGSGRGSQAKDDGTFTLPDISPGLYRLEVNAPSGLYAKSIRYAGQDVTKTSLDLTAGSGGQFEILLSPNPAGISGIVQGSDGVPLAGVTLTLWTPGIPPDGAPDFTRTNLTGNDGHFKFADLPPGEYRVAAWEQIDQGLGVVPEFRAKFDDKATAVKLQENDHAQIQPALIPRDAIETEAAKLH